MSAAQRIAVRPAHRRDAETLVAFSTALAWETEGRSLDEDRLRRGTLAVLESESKGFYLVAEAHDGASDSVIGQLLVTYEWSDWRNGTFWWIQSVYVAPAWRGRRVYKLLHGCVVKRARSRPDICGIRLYVEETNKTAQMVYTRVGLQPSTYRVFEQDFVLPNPEGRPPSS